MPLDQKKLIESKNRLVVFEDKHIRRIFHNDEWYFSVIDIIAVLTESSNPRQYWSDLKIQLSENEGFVQLYEKIVQLKLESSDGKWERFFYENPGATSNQILEAGREIMGDYGMKTNY